MLVLALDGELRQPRVLVVDNEPYVRTMLCDLLAVWGCVADAAEKAGEALERLSAGAYDLLLTDFRMPGMTGVELVERVRERDGALPVIMLTTSAADFAVAGRRLGFTLLHKPLAIHELKTALGRALGDASALPAFVDGAGRA